MEIDLTNVKAPRPLREELADRCHQVWAHRTKYCLDKLEPLIEEPRPGEQRHPSRSAEAAVDEDATAAILADQSAREQEAQERAELARLRAKYPDPETP